MIYSPGERWCLILVYCTEGWIVLSTRLDRSRCVQDSFFCWGYINWYSDACYLEEGRIGLCVSLQYFSTVWPLTPMLLRSYTVQIQVNPAYLHTNTAYRCVFIAFIPHYPWVTNPLHKRIVVVFFWLLLLVCQLMCLFVWVCVCLSTGYC